jgi:hypothetical protein
MFGLGGGVFGLTEDYAAKVRGATKAPSASVPSPALDKLDVESFAAEERSTVLRWLEVNRVCFDRYPMRRWRTPRDHAFISYAWRDDPDAATPSRVADACAAAGIEHFLDRRNVASKEGAWRITVARAVAECTHFFVVVSPNIGSGGVVQREIEMAVQRWTLEMSPTVICIAEPAAAEQLRHDPAVPLVVRFLLTFAPRMTPEEAAQPALVRYVVEFTRRTGRMHDWLPFLSPATTLARATRLPGIAIETGATKQVARL